MRYHVSAHKRSGILNRWHVTKIIVLDADAPDEAVVAASEEITELNRRHPPTCRIEYDMLQCIPSHLIGGDDV